MNVLGIDPGASGALALIDIDTREVTEVIDMPVHSIKINGRNKRRVAPQDLAIIMRRYKDEILFACIEQVSAMPKQGVASTFAFGQAYMAVEMACAAYQVPYVTVPPAQWKRVMGCTGNKDEARRTASRIMPASAELWPLVKHDGRAEAALLGLYGLRVHGATFGITPDNKPDTPEDDGGGLLS